ncbi:MAG: Atu1372/SO_1960 family protein [Alphaproteobacteria bacterium]
MRITSSFCDRPGAPFGDVAVRRVAMDPDGEAADSMVVPSDWPQRTSRALAAFDLPDAALPFPAAELPACLSAPTAGIDNPVLRVVDRLAARWTAWGWRLGLFDQADDAAAFFDDMRWLLAHRRLGPDQSAWRGINGSQARIGHAIDPFSGVMTPAHALPGFTPADHVVEPEATPLDNVVALMRSSARGKAAAAMPADLPAPVLAIDVARFVDGRGRLDAGALAAAARLAAIAAEIELGTRVWRTEALARAMHAYRPAAVGPANLAGLVLGQGLGHDGEAGRALAVAVAGLITAACAAASAEIADEAGPCPGFAAARAAVAAGLAAAERAWTAAVDRLAHVARPGALATLAASLDPVAGPLWAAARDGTRAGLRHCAFTALPSGRVDPLLPLELHTFGAAPLPALLLDHEHASGRRSTQVVPELDPGLAALGHGAGVRAAAIRHLRGRRRLDGAPGIPAAALLAKGLPPAALARLETALAEAHDIRHVFNRWVLGAEACRALGLDPVQCEDFGYDMLAAIGFDADAIAAANRHCLGAGTLVGTPGLPDADARALSPERGEAAGSEARMTEALDLVLSRPSPAPQRASTPPAQLQAGALSDRGPPWPAWARAELLRAARARLSGARRCATVPAIEAKPGPDPMTSAVEERLRALGIALPDAPAPAANYVPFQTAGELVFVSGQLPMVDGKVAVVGKLGADVDLDRGREAARLCMINILAQMKRACGGDLDRIAQCVRVGGFVNCVDGYADQPKVINGASDLVVDVLGDRGRHARAAVGVNALPLGAAVEVEAVFRLG